MGLNYNGLVFQEPLKTLRYEQLPILDDASNYLFTQHTLHVRGVLNPSTTSYRGAAISVGGQLPAITEAAIRHQAEQSRGQLIYSNGDNTILTSPANGASVDANNGPVVIGKPIITVHGVKTFEVELVIRTWINEESLYVAVPSTVVSHTWRMRHSIDYETMLCTRTTHGRVVCRSDRLAALGANVDDFRKWLALPVPVNFQREHIDVTAAENGTEAEYVIIDAERAINIVAPGGVTKIEGTWIQSANALGPEEYATRQIWSKEGYVTSGLNIVGGAAMSERKDGSTAYNPIGTAIAIGGMLVGASVRQSMFEMGNAPRSYHTLIVRVWGDRRTTNNQLQAVGVKVIQNRLAIASNIQNGNRVFASIDFTSARDFHRKFVELRCSLRSGPSDRLIPAGANANQGLASLPFIDVPDNDGVDGITTTADSANPAPSGDGVSRGTYLGGLVAAALRGQNAVPTAPTDPRQAQTLTPP